MHLRLIARWSLIFLALIAAALACQRPSADPDAPWSASNATPPPLVLGSAAAPTSMTYLPVVRDADDPIYTPTPDAPHDLPHLRTQAEEYTVQSGDTLGTIAQAYGVSLEMLIEANELVNPNYLSVGQVLVVPPPDPGSMGPSFKIVPDSELVYGPLSENFDVAGFVQEKGGYLARYHEDVEGETLSGAQIVQRVASEFSVNPRLLLAVLEYRSGWVTESWPDENFADYPMGVYETWREGLYAQMAWAANYLNRGYYLWRVDGVSTWILADGSVRPVNPTINAGTAGVQQMFALVYGQAEWEAAVTEAGVFSTFYGFFGYPFDLAVEPLVPSVVIPARDAASLRAGRGLGLHRRAAWRLGRRLCMGRAGFCPRRRGAGLCAERCLGGGGGRWVDHPHWQRRCGARPGRRRAGA